MSADVLDFTVGLAQIAPSLGNIEKNMEKCLAVIDQALERGVNLLIFPELGLTGYFLRDIIPAIAKWDDDEAVVKLLDKSRQLSIVMGYVEERKDHQFFNTAVFLENGHIVHKHRKVYLPTYGMFDEQRYFSAGDRIRAFSSKYGIMGMLVCEDAWHPSTAYVLSCDGADGLIILASSPGRGMSSSPELDSMRIWEEINRTYSRLFSCFVFFANRVGFEDGVNFWGGSEVIDPEGNCLAKAKYFEEELLVVKIDRAKLRRVRTYTPLLRDERLHLTLSELQRIVERRFTPDF